MMQTGEQKKNWYVSHFEVFEKSLNGESTSAVHEIRRAAIRRFEELGFPTTSDEEWKYTDVSPIAKARFKPVLGSKSVALTLKDIERFTFKHQEWNRMVFVNGHFSSVLSSLHAVPNGVKLSNLSTAMKSYPQHIERHLARYARSDENAFTALSAAFLQDGAFVHIPDRIVLEDPIHLLFVSTDDETEYFFNPRNLIIAGKSSQVSLIESHVGMGANVYFTNAVAEFVIGENAVVEYDRFQNESDNSFHIGTTHVYQERNSNFTSNAFSLGGVLVRNNITAVLDGEGAEATLNGMYLGIERQHIDNHTTIDHAKPRCNSHELYKGILDGKSRGVFNGKIFVRKDAQKTDAKQTNKNLVLSNEASINTKPQLEIFANDVKCTHGATVGQLDDEAIFYLRSRGISAEKARDMLIYAFAADVIDRVKVEPLREQFHGLIHDQLERGRKRTDA